MFAFKSKWTHTYFASVHVASLLSVPGPLLFISLLKWFQIKRQPDEDFIPSQLPIPVPGPQHLGNLLSFQKNNQYVYPSSHLIVRWSASYLNRAHGLLRTSCFFLSALWIYTHACTTDTQFCSCPFWPCLTTQLWQFLSLDQMHHLSLHPLSWASEYISVFKSHQPHQQPSLTWSWNLLLQPDNSVLGFPGGSVVKNLPAKARDLGLIPGLGRSPRRRKEQTTPVFLPGKPPGQRSLVGYSPWSHKESDGM